jgi:hypothetical protein
MNTQSEVSPPQELETKVHAAPEQAASESQEASSEAPMWNLEVVPVAPNTPMLRQRCIR